MTSAAAKMLIALTDLLGPPVATPEVEYRGDGTSARPRWRVFRWTCPACGGGLDDPQRIWRPFSLDSEGGINCNAPGCSERDLAVTLITLLEVGS